MEYGSGITLAPEVPGPAYDNLQAAIMRLSIRETPKGAERDRELKPLVDQALEAYTDYMKAVGGISA